MLSSSSSLLYFADICAGPGGFTEYVLWRKGWKAKGVGFTLRNANDFKLNDFYAASPESFEAYYGKFHYAFSISLHHITSTLSHMTF
jgi:cap1 methyltransferase